MKVFGSPRSPAPPRTGSRGHFNIDLGGSDFEITGPEDPSGTNNFSILAWKCMSRLAIANAVVTVVIVNVPLR